MSTLETEDLKASGAFTAERDGYEFTLEYILSNVSGTNSIAQMFNAMTDSKIPLTGSDLSDVDVRLAGCWLRSIRPEMISPGKVRLILHWAHNPANILVIEAGSSLNQVTTNKDKTATAISLEYEYPDPNPLKPELAGVTVTQGGTFTKLVPERTLVYHLRELNSPQAFAHLFEGKVNDATWQSGAAGTWMCSSITGRSDNSGENFSNTYTFQYRKDGWDPEVVYIDPASGKPPDDVTAAGQKIVATYDSFTFTDLFPAT